MSEAPNRLRKLLTDDRFQIGPGPRMIIREFLEEFEENEGVIKVLRRQRNQAESKLEEIKKWSQDYQAGRGDYYAGHDAAREEVQDILATNPRA